MKGTERTWLYVRLVGGTGSLSGTFGKLRVRIACFKIQGSNYQTRKVEKNSTTVDFYLLFSM